LREGQAYHSSTATTPLPDDNNNGSDYPDLAEEDVNETIEEATEEITVAEDEELAKETSMLGSAVNSMGNKLRIGLGKLLGKNVDDEELESIASEVETKLNNKVGEELQEAADQLTENEVDKMESNVDEDMQEGVGTEGIEEDVWNQERGAESRIRSGIDSAADEIQAGMKKKAAEIEKEILEQRLTERLGKPVKLVIVDDEVKGVDDLFEGLDNLVDTGKHSGTSGSTGYSSGNQGSGYSSSYTSSGGGTSSYGTTQSQQGISSNTYSSLRTGGTTSYGTTESKPKSDNNSNSEDSKSKDGD